MPYNFIKPNKSPEIIDNVEEDKIQQELNLWREQMRKERQKRLLAAAARAERTRNNITQSNSRESSPQIQNENDSTKSLNHYTTTALQEYRRELNETASALQEGKIKTKKNSINWFMNNKPIKHQTRIKQKGIVYHKAQSVIKEYINRPPLSPPKQKIPKTPNGALKAYKDALSNSVRAYSNEATRVMYSSPSTSSSSWHQKPLRSISVSDSHNVNTILASTQLTRSTMLRKKHTDLLRRHQKENNNNNNNNLDFMNHKKQEGIKHNLSLEYHSKEQIKAAKVYEKAIQDQEYQQRNWESINKNEYFEDSKSSISSSEGQRRSATQPMNSSPYSFSPQPRNPTYIPYNIYEEEEIVNNINQKSEIKQPLTDIVVSPPTPVPNRNNNNNNNNNISKHREIQQARRESSPLLTELLSKLTLPTPNLYRPDLFQGNSNTEVAPVARIVHPKPQPRIEINKSFKEKY